MLQSTDSAGLEDDEDLCSDGDAGDVNMPSMVSATMLRQMRCAAGTILFCSYVCNAAAYHSGGSR